MNFSTYQWGQIQCARLTKLMLHPLNPNDFCQKWVPKKTGKSPSDYGYRKECCKLLAQITSYEESTCNNWLSTPETIPKLVRPYLRSIDLLWKIKNMIPLSLEGLENVEHFPSSGVQVHRQTQYSNCVLLEPNEFCQRWLKSHVPGEWGYRRACVKLLSETTGLSERTIENWGKDFSDRPDYILTILKKDNALREIQETFKKSYQPRSFK